MTANIKNLSDEQIVEQYIITSNNGYMAILFKRYAHLVLGICFKYFPDEIEAEDKMMDIFELVIKKIPNQEIKYFKSWLFIVCKNYLLREIERKKSGGKTIPFDVEKKSDDQSVEFQHSSYLNSTDDGEIEINDIEFKEENVRKAVELLKDDQKKCITQFFYENKSYQEISDETGIEMNMVKSHIQNGKKRIKSLLINKA